MDMESEEKLTLLEFRPRGKRQKKFKFPLDVSPFPVCAENKKFKGVFTGLSVEVCDEQEIVAIYNNGCYGKGSNSRGVPQVLRPSKSNSKEAYNSRNFTETLTLDLEEAFFLTFYLDVLAIENLSGHVMDWKAVLKEFQYLKPNFVHLLVAYLHFKSEDWVVKSGIKLGGDYVLYEKGPHYNHASFVVIVTDIPSVNEMSCNYIQGLQRVAESSKKKLLILQVEKPSEISEINSPEDLDLYSVSESVVHRFNATQSDDSGEDEFTHQ